MTTARRFTHNPFTVAVCTACDTEVTEVVIPKLRTVIRSCPHGVLVVTRCMLGSATCAARTSEKEMMLILQPCTVDRVPVSSVQWVGPVCDGADADTVCAWIAAGTWDPTDLPMRLRADVNLARSSRMN
ncbi:MAG: hypothetical protein SW019_01365 [Actinomycetota bacterium]|nr:hypothetical protein [Actinomycetota bacterium]